MKRLRRFEYCSDELFPCIEKVLELLPCEVKEAFLNDKYVQVISSGRPARGFQLTFNKKVEPAKSIIYINTCQIKKQCVIKDGLTEKDYFIYGIAHEMGHHFAGKGESWLLEKEANDWLKKWKKFDELINKINDPAPRHEEEGYIYGYSWAKGQNDDWAWEEFKPFMVFWDEIEISNINENKEINNLINKVSGILDTQDCGYYYTKGCAFGIMKRIREIANGN